METPVGRDGGGGLQREEAKEGRRAYETYRGPSLWRRGRRGGNDDSEGRRQEIDLTTLTSG